MTTASPAAPARPRCFHPPLWLLLLTLLSLVPVAPGLAATLTVTNTNDGGAGSLRQAIASASPGDTVAFDPTVFATPQTIALTSGELVIGQNLTVLAPASGLRLDLALPLPTPAFRVLHITGGTVNLSNLDISIGRAPHGGGVKIDAGAVTMNNCRVSGCDATGGPSETINGGGVHNAGTLTLNACTVSGNFVQHSNQSTSTSNDDGSGGGIYNVGTLTVNGCTITNNGSDSGLHGSPNGPNSGGGIYSAGTLTISDSTLQGNNGTFGGGLYNSGSATLSRCALYGNSATGGGGLYNFGSLAAVNCTITENMALAGYNSSPFGQTGGYWEGSGAGIYHGTGVLTLTSCTVAFNGPRGHGRGPVITFGAGGGIYSAGGVTLRACIVAANSIVGTGQDLSGPFQSAGSNVVGQVDADSSGLTGGVGHDQAGTPAAPLDAGLDTSAAAQPNGGPTNTVALTPGSPALKADYSTNPPATDQRGVPRPNANGARPDAGAFQATSLANDDAYTTTPNTPLATPASGVLTNDVDVDSQGRPLTAVLSRGPAQAAAFALNPDGSFTYTPAAGFTGADTFAYQASVGGFLSNPATVTITVKDTSPPVTTAALSPSAPSGLNGWYTGPVTVTLSATDPDGVADVAATVYALDGGAPQPYVGPIPITGDAVHTLTFHSVDRAGNAEAAQSLTVRIDGSPPVTAGVPVVTPATGAAGGSARVTLTATDALSGVAATVYSLDGGAPQAYAAGTPVAIAGAGAHTLTFHSTDAAGNAEAPRTLSVTLTARVLHTFPAGLQMIAVPEDYSGVPLAQAWGAPAGQLLTGWGASYVTSPALPALGRGAWVRLAGPTDLFDAGTPAPTAAPFPVPLAAGWNLVGSPFPATVGGAGLVVKDALGGPHTLAQANRLGLVSSTTYGYPAGATGYQAQGPGGSLQPYQGYWVYAFRPCTLLIPPPAAAAAARR